MWRRTQCRLQLRRAVSLVAILALAPAMVVTDVSFAQVGDCWTPMHATTGLGPPIATLSSSTHPLEDNWYADAAPVFDWSAGGAGDIAGYSFVVDQSPDTVPDATSEGGTAWASCAGLADGVWYFHVRAEDGLGCWGPTATRIVRVDTTAPVTGDDVASDWCNRAVVVTMTGSDAGSGVASTEYSTDGGGTWTRGSQTTVAAPADHSNDGVHTILYRSTDGAGNLEVDKATTVGVDTRPPGFSWRSVYPRVLRRGGSVELRFSVEDLTGTVRASCWVYDAWGHRVACRGGSVLSPGASSLTVPAKYAGGRAFLPGLYRVGLRLVDAAGNVKVTRAASFRDYRPARTTVWRSVPGAGRRVALTFDDGANKAAWASILTTLRARGVHATFFLNGCYVAGSPALARRTVAWGNAIGSHTWSHTSLTRLTRSQVQYELRRDVAAWWYTAHATPVPYVRVPYGNYDGATLDASGSIGFARLIQWSVDPTDWAAPGSAAIASRVLSHVHSGAIVILHVRSDTAAALPTILAGLHARGYRVVTLPALFRAAGYR